MLATLAFDRGAFACALGRGDQPRLFVVGQEWEGPDGIGGATGKVASFAAPSPGAGHP